MFLGDFFNRFNKALAELGVTKLDFINHRNRGINSAGFLCEKALAHSILFAPLAMGDGIGDSTARRFGFEDKATNLGKLLCQVLGIVAQLFLVIDSIVRMAAN